MLISCPSCSCEKIYRHGESRNGEQRYPPSVSPLLFDKVTEQTGLKLVCEMDEQWPYVCSKANQCWLWYAWSPHLKTVFAYALGSRQDSVLATLLERLKDVNFRLYCTDDWGAYKRLLPRFC